MRYAIAIGGLILVIGALVFVKFSQISMLINMGKEMEQAGPPPEAVASATASEQTWEATVTAVGNVASVKGVAISNDAPGVVTRIHFDSGARVKKDDLLVELDTSVERAQLNAAQVRLALAQTTAKRTRALAGAGVSTQAQVDNDESQLKSAAADIDVLQAQIKRKVVRAPFGGKLGIRNVNVGQYLNPGAALTTLESVDGVFVDFTLPQQQAVAVGLKVRVSVEGAPKLAREGVITAIDPTVDATTRNIKLRATVADNDNSLQPGMFVNLAVVLPNTKTAVAVPATAVVHAPYGDSVFIIEPPADGAAERFGPNGEPVKVARQQFVRVGERRGDYVSLLDGVKAGEEVVSAGAFKLRNKAPVFVNNALATAPSLGPNPENR